MFKKFNNNEEKKILSFFLDTETPRLSLIPFKFALFILKINKLIFWTLLQCRKDGSKSEIQQAYFLNVEAYKNDVLKAEKNQACLLDVVGMEKGGLKKRK